MKNLYNKTKKAIKTTTAIAGLAASLAFGGQDAKAQSYLPISEKQKTEQFAYLDSLSREANKTVKLAEESFQAGIADKHYTVEEMGNTLSLYRKADSLYNKVSSLGASHDAKYKASLPEDARQVKNSLAKTVEGLDQGTSNLEEKLNEAGMDVKVDNPFTEGEGSVIGVVFLGACLLGLTGYIASKY